MNRPDIKNWVMILTIMILTGQLAGCRPSSPARLPGTAAPAPAASTTPEPSIHLQPCMLGELPAECGVLSVYENRATKAGRTIDIHVAVIKASEPNPAPDPIFYLAGGPGGSAIDAAGYAMLMLKTANQRRDLVLVDQRGTGQSNRMACPRQVEESLGLVPIDDAMLQDLRACLTNLNGNPSAYTTAWGMDDLDDVRAALGNDQINLYGESYGPTAEQVYLSRHGDHVRTMALEGVTLLDVPMMERMPRSSQQALDLLYARCRADKTCNSAYPNLSDEVQALIARLEKQPVELSLTNPQTGKNILLNRAWLVQGIHGTLYSTPTAVLLPSLLHQAYLGNWSGIEKIVSNDFAPGSTKPEWIIMNLTILCHEDWARASREETTRFSAGSYMAYEDVRRFSVPEPVCALIPRPQPEALYQPVTTSPVPVLIISDQADPGNPPENVATAKEHYPNSLALVAPGQGHGYTGFPCRDQILAAFIEKGTTQGLNADCLQKEPLPPIP